MKKLRKLFRNIWEELQQPPPDYLFRYSCHQEDYLSIDAALLIQNGEAKDLLELLMTLKEFTLSEIPELRISLSGSCLVIQLTKQEMAS